MKSTLKTLAIALLSLTLVISCKKNDTTTPETTVTEDDAADVVASAIGTGGYGFTSSANEASQKTNFGSNTPQPCLYSLDTTYTKASPAGSLFVYNYSLRYKYQMFCTNGILQNMVFDLITSGNIDFPRVSGTTNATGKLTITGLNPSATAYVANGTYVRNGSATSKVRNKNTFTYQVNLSVSNLSVLKSNYSVQSGTGTVTISATTTSGKVFNFTGALTYVNATTATLVIGTRTFTINLPDSSVL